MHRKECIGCKLINGTVHYSKTNHLNETVIFISK